MVYAGVFWLQNKEQISLSGAESIFKITVWMYVSVSAATEK